MSSAIGLILRQLLDLFFTFLAKAFTELFNVFFGGLSEGLSLAWSNPVISVFLYTANLFSWAIFFFGFVFFVLKVAQEERRNWYAIYRCPINAIIFIALNQTAVKVCFLAADMFVTGISNIDYFKDMDLLKLDFSSYLSGFVTVAMLIAFIYFTYTTVMRFGAMFIQILLAPFYVPFILMGDDQKVSEWMLGTVAIGFTYLIQFLLFYCGLVVFHFAGSDFWSYVAALSLMFSTMSVPAQMQKFGWGSGGGNAMSAAYMGINAASSLIKLK